MKQEYELPKKAVNVSKIILRNGKAYGIIPNLSVIHYKLQGKHNIRLYKNIQAFDFVLDDDIKKVIVYSRDEQKQYKMSQIYKETDFPKIRYFIGELYIFKSILS